MTVIFVKNIFAFSLNESITLNNIDKERKDAHESPFMIYCQVHTETSGLGVFSAQH